MISPLRKRIVPMPSLRLLTQVGLLVTAFALAFPALAGTLAPQLRTLADSYQKTPEKTLNQARQPHLSSSPRLFAPHVNAAGKVQVYIHYRAGALPEPAALARIGAGEVLTSDALNVIQAWVPIANLDRAAALAGVNHVTLPDYSYVRGGADPQPTAAADDQCEPVDPDLDINHTALAAQHAEQLEELGITGKGVKIGIVSDGADCRAVSQAQGYLPADIFIPEHLRDEGDEGTAMLEEVHAIAPDATLGACGPKTSAEFLECLDTLAQWGADIISDDLGYLPNSYNFSVFTNPTTGENAIVEFARAHPGISLITAGGNDAEDYFEANYTPTTQPTNLDIGTISLSPDYTTGGIYPKYEAADRNYVSALDFGAVQDGLSDAAITVTIEPGADLDANLTWNDPAGGPYDDLDLFLLEADGSMACSNTDSHWCSSTMDQMSHAGESLPAPFESGLPPFEFIHYTNETDSTQTLYLVVLCYDCSAHGTQPLHVKLYGFMGGGGAFNYVTNGGVPSHANLGVVIAAAAARYEGHDQSAMEAYSDTGPFTYGDWLSGPKTRSKPDITAISSVLVSGAGGFGEPRPHGGAFFAGTSAASPNVAGVLALLRGAFPDAAANAEEWEQIINDTASKDAISDYSDNASGSGLIDATAAVTSLDPPLAAQIAAPAGSTATAFVSTPVNFKGQCDYAGGFPLDYKWTFGQDSGVPDSRKLDPQPVQYTHTGSYTVTFTCSNGLQSESATVTVKAKEMLSGGGGAFGGLALGMLAGFALMLVFLRRRR